MTQHASPQNAEELRCSFCHKGQSDVARLISNPLGTVYICDECIEVCHIILEKGSELPSHPTTDGS